LESLGAALGKDGGVMEYWLVEMWPGVEWERLYRYYGLGCE
jgi:hypothetical protein